jgi:phytoene synthase
MTRYEHAATLQILARHSKSFALAGKLLPPWCRRDAAALYAWCRRCDDAVDVPEDAAARAAAVTRLRLELGAVYEGDAQDEPVLAAMQDVVTRHGIPRCYCDDLIEGMAMDVGLVRYQTMDELLLYCYRAAGTVGLMMAHVMGVRDAGTLRRAADLGLAMQLTNICRDVAEDELRGRVYLPAALGGGGGAVTGAPERTAAAVAEVLRRAEALYGSGDAGLGRLPLRCAVAIRAAGLIYREIGAVIARRGFDVRAGRAVVSRSRKLWLMARAVCGTVVAAAWRGLSPAAGGAASTGPALVPLPFDLPLAGAAAQDQVAARAFGVAP